MSVCFYIALNLSKHEETKKKYIWQQKKKKEKTKFNLTPIHTYTQREVNHDGPSARHSLQRADFNDSTALNIFTSLFLFKVATVLS